MTVASCHQRVTDQKPRREHHRAQARHAAGFRVIGHEAVGGARRRGRGGGDEPREAVALPGAISIGIGLVVFVT